LPRKSPDKGSRSAASTLRSQDPHLAREREKYPEPLPSREFILDCVESAGIPVEIEDLQVKLDILPEEVESFSRRLRAMEREGQLMRNRRNALCIPAKLDLIKARVEGHPDGFGFAIPDDHSGDFFLGPKEMHKALHGDIVLVRAGAMDKRGRREGFISEVLERANNRLIARLHSEHGVMFAVAENRRISQDILVAPGQTMGAEAGQVVIEPELDIMSLRGILKPIPGVDITHVENDPEGPDWPGGCDPLPDAEWVQNSKREGTL